MCIRDRFFPIYDTTGEGLTTALLKEIEETCGLDMKNCRGEGYDNGGNMTGKYKGVQSRILSMFPKAFSILVLSLIHI